jgi:hypothetical protein
MLQVPVFYEQTFSSTFDYQIDVFSYICVFYFIYFCYFVPIPLSSNKKLTKKYIFLRFIVPGSESGSIFRIRIGINKIHAPGFNPDTDPAPQLCVIYRTIQLHSCIGTRGGVRYQQATWSHATKGAPGEWAQVHGCLPQAANFLLTLQGLHLVSTGSVGQSSGI